MRQVVENACGSYQSFTFVPGRTLVLTKKKTKPKYMGFLFVFCSTWNNSLPSVTANCLRKGDVLKRFQYVPRNLRGGKLSAEAFHVNNSLEYFF